MSAIVTLDLIGWHPAMAPGAQDLAVRAIEDGGVLALPHVNFELSERERRFLSPDWSDGRAKNISLDAHATQSTLKGAQGGAADLVDLKAMVARFAANAAGLVVTMVTRGLTQPGLFPEVEHVCTDRDGGLGVLAGRRWEAIIDVCGYLPRVVVQSVGLVADRYLFVSSVSAFTTRHRVR